MAINMVGVPFNDIKNQVYANRDTQDMSNEVRLNFSETIIPNIQAMQVNGRVFAGVFPNMSQMENDMCSWY